jgi:hypothetical protein
VERNRKPTNRNRIQGVVVQGERASDREALSAKEPLCRSGRLCGEGHGVLPGELSPDA